MSQTSIINYRIRQAKTSDLEQFKSIGQELDFIQYKHLNSIMMNVDAEGTIVAELEDTGEIIGMCSGFNLSPDLAFIGQYGVRPVCQGQGIGSAMWSKVIQRLSQRNIGLYPTRSMAPKYQVNFPNVNEKRVCFFTGKPFLDHLCQNVDDVSIESVTDRNIDAVVEYDRHICADVNRRSLIEQLPTAPELVISVAFSSGRVVGYGVLCRSTTNEAMIAGLYADDQSIAETLVGHLCDRLTVSSDQQMLYFCWNCNQNSISIAHKLGLLLVEEVPILFSKHVVNGDQARMYCTTNQFYPF